MRTSRPLAPDHPLAARLAAAELELAARLARNIKRLRNHHGINAAIVANAAGLRWEAYRAIEDGDASVVALDVLARLGRALRVDPADLLSDPG